MKFKKRNQPQRESSGSGEVHSMYEDAHKRLFFRKKKTCPLAGVDDSLVNYKNIELLSRFISERGRILPARITGLSAANQDRVRKEIKVARILALMPFVKY